MDHEVLSESSETDCDSGSLSHFKLCVLKYIHKRQFPGPSARCTAAAPVERPRLRLRRPRRVCCRHKGCVISFTDLEAHQRRAPIQYLDQGSQVRRVDSRVTEVQDGQYRQHRSTGAGIRAKFPLSKWLRDRSTSVSVGNFSSAAVRLRIVSSAPPKSLMSQQYRRSTTSRGHCSTSQSLLVPAVPRLVPPPTLPDRSRVVSAVYVTSPVSSVCIRMDLCDRSSDVRFGHRDSNGPSPVSSEKLPPRRRMLIDTTSNSCHFTPRSPIMSPVLSVLVETLNFAYSNTYTRDSFPDCTSVCMSLETCHMSSGLSTCVRTSRFTSSWSSSIGVCDCSITHRISSSVGVESDSMMDTAHKCHVVYCATVFLKMKI